MQESAPKIEKKSMGEKEAKDFLTRKGAIPLQLKDWQPGEPIIVVFSERARDNIATNEAIKPTREIPKDMIPCLVRMDEPASIRYDPTDGELKFTNFGGQKDNYTIDLVTEKITCVRSSKNPRSALEPYTAPVGNIYKSLDALFPKQPIPTKPHEK